MRFSQYNGPPGSLIAGANDNCVGGGYAYYSDLNPYVVMDGMGTVAAEPHGYGTTSFSGTSSSSPRITGYAAHVLYTLREAFDYRQGVRDGALILLDDPAAWPQTGPLADGRLTSAELHEIIRRTADADPHESKYDGAEGFRVPQPAPTPFSVYAKMGYGEVSEHTLPHAVAVALGQEPMPERPVEDEFYEASETFRETYWGP